MVVPANINLVVRSDNISYMKAFDIGELKKTARVKELEVNRSYSEIHKSPLRSSTQENLPATESYYLTRWGRSLENREESGWVNVGQGIVAVSVGEEHALILNSNSSPMQTRTSATDMEATHTDSWANRQKT
jgi:hypothetical protein